MSSTITIHPGVRATGVETRRLLVTGCGRCGTTYASVLLRRAGLDMPHERRVGADGISSWLFAAESVGKATVPWGPAPAAYGFDHVVHLVRDPLTSIPSLATFRRSAWRYIGANVALDPDEPVLPRAARYWLLWNELVERRTELRVRIETLSDALPAIGARIGAPLDPSAVPELRKDLNTRRHGRLFASFESRCLRFGVVPAFAKALLSRFRPRYEAVTWADLAAADPALARAVRAKAHEYGYRYADDKR